jgi:hypothetical protein
MQQRQLRLGDILDDYCPRERRVTNHAVVAMVGAEVKQTRCTTCDAEHEFKHAKIPRQRRKSETPAALYSQVLAGGPKRVVHEPPDDREDETTAPTPSDGSGPVAEEPDQSERAIAAAGEPQSEGVESNPDSDIEADEREHDVEQGPAHRRLIRATLPRQEGQPPPTRPAPEFTIRQPTSRPGRFRPRHQRGPSPFHTGPGGNRSGNFGGGGGPRHSGGRPPIMSHSGKRHGPSGGGRKRSK